MNKNKPTQTEGFALLLSLIISSIALSIGLSLLQVTLKQLELGNTTLGSEVAFQAASAGMECVRHVRDIEASKYIQGDPVVMDCFNGAGATSADTTGAAASGFRHAYLSSDINWTPATEARCLKQQVIIADASAATGDQTVLLPDRPSATCQQGDICTYAFVQGYNTPCANIGSSLSVVQRELTAEF